MQNDNIEKHDMSMNNEAESSIEEISGSFPRAHGDQTLSKASFLLLVCSRSFCFPVLIHRSCDSEPHRVSGDTGLQIERISDMVSTADFIVADGRTYTCYDKSQTVVVFKAPPSSEHWLGTDTSGFDILTRLMYGGRISLAISFIVIILETIIGIIFGGLAGYFGKWVDQLIMRVVDTFACLPSIPILLVLSAAISSIESIGRAPDILPDGVINLMGWTGVARIVRGQILALRSRNI